MQSHVTVSWSEQQSRTFDLDEVQPMPHELARQWLDDQFADMDCEPLRATGKLLQADKVLRVAEAAGWPCFRDERHNAWALTFARATCATLGKPVVHLDLAAMAVTY